jgi:hypothetical protein
VQADPLLADDDRADVLLGGGLDDLVDRVADEELDAFLLENLRDGGGGFQGWALLFLGGGPEMAPTPPKARKRPGAAVALLESGRRVP